jgi:hypothetical protein
MVVCARKGLAGEREITHGVSGVAGGGARLRKNDPSKIRGPSQNVGT